MRQRLSAWVALRCKEAAFQRFLGVTCEAEAAAKVRALCGVTSRGEIDRDAGAAQRFHQFIRRPFINYQEHTHV